LLTIPKVNRVIQLQNVDVTVMTLADYNTSNRSVLTSTADVANNPFSKHRSFLSTNHIDILPDQTLMSSKKTEKYLAAILAGRARPLPFWQLPLP
jgi:DeoR/GlpR family transcriptional regulator of sugar metabolism